MIRPSRRRRSPLDVLVRTVVLALALVLAVAPSAGAWEEEGGEGQREQGPKFSPPAELLERVAGVPDFAAVGMVFGAPAGAGERADALATWSGLGPTPITAEYWSGNQPASGRVNSIVVDPRDGNVAYCAAAYGGVWKTIDGGTLWTPMTDLLPNLSSGSVVLDPIDPDIVWYGTGEQNFALDSYPGDGLFRSPDGGATWVKIANKEAVGSYISRLVIHPTMPDTMYSASDRGVVRSTDGGSTWTVVFGGSWCTDLVIHPTSPDILYAAMLYWGVYRSTDGGLNWTHLTGGLPINGFFRPNLAISPSNPSVLLAGFDDSNYSLLGLYRTSDGGDNWTQLVNTPDYLAGQGFYNHVLAFDPANSAISYAAGVYPYDASRFGIVRTGDSGNTWVDITQGLDAWVHPDMHALAFGPDGRLWVGCDGGVWRTADGGAHWSNLNSTLSITQFYTVAVQPGYNPVTQTYGARVIGGTQDNGTVQYSGLGSWTQMVAGDGGPTEFNRTTNTVFYCTYVNLNPLYRGTVTGSTVSNITGPWTSDRASWANGGLTVDPNASTTLLAGTYRVWRTTNEGSSWTAISTDLTGGAGTIRALAVATGNTNNVLAATSDGRLQTTSNLSTWTRRDTGLPAGITIPSIAVDPMDPNDVVVASAGTSGGRVYASSDQGLTWTNVTGDLPSPLQVNALTADFRVIPPAYHVATNVGVYTSADGGAHWTLSGAGLPASAVLGVAVDPVKDQLIAATHGRGMWRVSLPVVASPRIASVSPAFQRVGGSSLTVTVLGTNFRPGATLTVDGVARATTFVNGARLTATLDAADVAATGDRALRVVGPATYAMASPAVDYPVLDRASTSQLFDDANVSRTDGAAGATAIAYADFDGDGLDDLALARYDANQVVVRRAQTDGTFAPFATFAVSGPRDLAAGDLDGDGRPDLVVAQPALSEVSMYYNSGGTGFTGHDSVTAGVAPQRVVLGDLDNDGRPDVVVGQTGAYLVRLFNDGPGTGGATRAYRRSDLIKTPFASPVGVALADVDRDGYLDYMTSNKTNTITGVVSGVGAFAVRSYVSGSAGVSVAAGYFNADSLPDYAVACSGDSIVAVFRNTGGGNFTRTVVPTRRNPLDLKATDVDGDGAVDLVMPCAGSQTLTVLLGTGTGTFSAPLDFDAGRRPAALAVRRDRLALAVADSLSDPVVLRLDGRLKGMSSNTGTAPRDAATADLDGDLSPDLVTANGDGTVSLLYGKGDGTFFKRADLATASAAQSVAIADLDGDAVLDLVALLRGGTLAFWRGTGGRTFAAQASVACDTAGVDLAVADGDGVGDALDLVVATPDGARVLTHTGGFTFAAQPRLDAPPGAPFGAARVADVDGDGTPDLIVGGPVQVQVHHGTGGGAFDVVPTAALYEGLRGRGLAVADLDGDSAPDLVYAATAGDLAVSRGLGAGAFAAPTHSATGGPADDLALADVTGDGRTDVVLADSTGAALRVVAGANAPSFAPFWAYRTSRGALGVAVADFDKDGRLDAAVAGSGDAFATLHVKLTPSGPLAVDPSARASALAFSDVHPNPAAGAQTIRFTTPRRGEVDLRVFDLAGRAVVTLAHGPFAAGEHTLEWNGRGANGTPVAPGVYFLRLRVEGEQAAARVARMR